MVEVTVELDLIKEKDEGIIEVVVILGLDLIEGEVVVLLTGA